MATTVTAVAFIIVFALSWRAGMRGWSLLLAMAAALVAGGVCRRLVHARLRHNENSAGDWTVLYRDETVGWRVLVGGERCSRSQADAARRELESRGYRVELMKSDQLDESGLSRSLEGPDRREEAGGAGS